MRIAILDDEKIFAGDLRERIISLDFYDIYTPEIRVFTDSAEFFADEKEFDIVFIDYKLGDETGMDVSKKIRQTNEQINIVFVTAYPEYVFDSFKVDAFRYLVKPVTDDDLREVLDSFVSRDAQYKIIKIPEKGKAKYFNVNSIIYLETEGRNTNIYTVDEKYTSKKPISEIEGYIDSPWFFRISRFFVVNFSYIK